METPIDFEIWGTVNTPLTVAIDIFIQCNPETARPEAMRTLLRSRSLGESVALASQVRWVDCQATRSILGVIAQDLVIYQTGWGRDPNAIWCPLHEVYYGGCLGCPICDPNSRLR